MNNTMAANFSVLLINSHENSTSGGDSEVEGLPSRIATSIGAAIMLVFFLEGMIGNLWIITAILMTRRVLNVINVFILSLCFNDILSLCLVLILIIDSYLWHRWTAGMTMCQLNPEFTVAFTGCSLWHTALIAIHRYIVVCHNTAYKRMSKRAYVGAVLLLTRLIPMACTIPGFTLTSSGYVPKLLRCIILPTQKGRIISVTFVQILAPCAIVVICYALIFGFVIRLSRSVHDTNLILQREIQITKMFGMIFLMILVGFVPYAVVRNADRGNTYSGDIYVVVSVFYGMATCSNPVVYGAMSTDVRKTCWQTLANICHFLKCERFVPCIPGVIEDSQCNTVVTLEMATAPLSSAANNNASPVENSLRVKLANSEERTLGNGEASAADV